MISNKEVRLAEWVIERACHERRGCYGCCHDDNCGINPYDWNIATPPPEPTERQRIEWLRMLPDGEMLDACHRAYMGKNDWWHEVVSLEQFRKDVGLI